MHALCGYPVKSTWIKDIQSGKFVGWPMLTTKKVQNYYPDTIKTPQGHMNQAQKNVISTKPKPLETTDDNQLQGKKQRDVFTSVYDVRETICSNQTGQSPKRSLSGNKYIIVMVDIDRSGIIVETMKIRKDANMIRAYTTLIQRLQQSDIKPKRYVLDNEISVALKTLIKDEYKMEIKLVPPG